MSRIEDMNKAQLKVLVGSDVDNFDDDLASNDLVTDEKPIPLDANHPEPMAAGLLPSWLGEMVESVAEETETPRELAAMFALSVMGACCQKKFSINIKTNYFEPLCIWTVAALESGNRKSSVMQTMTAPIMSWEMEQAESMQAEIQLAEETAANREEQIKVIRGQVAKAKEDAEFSKLNAQLIEAKKAIPEIPIPPKVWAQDITPEHLGTVMARHGEAMALLSSEGGIFDILGGRYSRGVPNLDLFLQAHSGDPVRTERASRGAVNLRHPALTLGLSPQPSVLHGLAGTPSFNGRGLLARFLYVLPASPVGSRSLNGEPVPNHVSAAYCDHIRALLEIEIAPDGMPHTLKLGADAYKEWTDFSHSVEAKLAEGGQYENVKAWGAKLPGAAARIAGLFHCAEHAKGEPWNHEISKATMEQALELAAVLSEHALAVFNLMGADPATEKARQVWRWIERNRQNIFSARDCFQGLRGTFPRMAVLNQSLQVLEERHYISQLKLKPIGPGRPRQLFMVNRTIAQGWV